MELLFVLFFRYMKTVRAKGSQGVAEGVALKKAIA